MLTANPNAPTETATVSQAVQEGYLATVRHLVDETSGHFSERHPDAKEHGSNARTRIVEAARNVVFQTGDLVWVEWDTEKMCIVSLGWHYYYRWAYTGSVRKDADTPRLERHGLFPLETERAHDDEGAPKELSAVRRLFGYAGDNDGSAGIGKNDHAQLMGRVFVNAGLEVVGEHESDDRFLKQTFLKELGMPRPSAVEHYLKQPHHPQSRPSDNATLVTYGDAAGHDAPGELAGRKFYLDRREAYSGTPWEDDSNANKQNDRSTLALEASKPSRKFRFTVRFRNLDAAELAAILVALCPDQFKGVLGGTHADGYCSKLGYARPLGWGSVRIEAKMLLLLDEASDTPTLKPEADLGAWVKNHHRKTATQDEWLAIHRRNHPNAADYPCKDGRIYTFHTGLRRALAQPPLQEGWLAMKTLLIMTVGQTDVQLVIDNVRHELLKKRCGELHDEMENRGFTIVEAPPTKKDSQIEALPDGELSVCLPKLDAVLRFFGESLPTHTLIFDTCRATPSDPRLAGRVLERRLKSFHIEVHRHTFLRDKEWLEDRLNKIDAIVRRAVVNKLDSAIRQKLDETGFDLVVIAATGGFPAVNDVIKELVRLHAVGRTPVTSLEIPDGSFTSHHDRAVEEKLHPAAGYRARWHALSLIEKGNLLAHGARSATSKARLAKSGHRSSSGSRTSRLHYRFPKAATSPS